MSVELWLRAKQIMLIWPWSKCKTGIQKQFHRQHCFNVVRQTGSSYWPLGFVLSYSIEVRTQDNSGSAYQRRWVHDLCVVCKTNTLRFEYCHPTIWTSELFMQGKRTMKHLWQVCKLLIVSLSQCYASLCSQCHHCLHWPSQYFLTG